MKRLVSGRAAVIIGGAISLAIIATAGVLVYRGQRLAAINLLSDDATLSANLVQVAASVAGRISAIHVQENDLVKAGDLLFELDDTTYRLAVEQARADLAIAVAAGSDQARNIRAEQANAAIASEQVERARANLALATQTLNRLLPMQSKGYVSTQQIDDARTAQRDAEVSLNESLRQLDAAEALIGDEEAAAALVRARQAALAIAEHALGSTRVYALADRRRAISGRVEGIGWGVASKDMIDLPYALPILPKSLDWVRVQQRFPVRIRLVDPPADLMRAGASAVAIVHDDDNGC